VALIKKDPDKSEKALVRFDEDWGQYETICRREGMRVKLVTISENIFGNLEPNCTKSHRAAPAFEDKKV
jgi:hypothetical protein